MAVWNIGMYSKSVTESSKSVLVEVLRILGSYRDYFILTGGWSPYFILEKFGEGGQHCGSVDIDFVLNPRLIDLKVYETIISLIKGPFKSSVNKLMFVVRQTFFILSRELNECFCERLLSCQCADKIG